MNRSEFVKKAGVGFLAAGIAPVAVSAVIRDVNSKAACKKLLGRINELIAMHKEREEHPVVLMYRDGSSEELPILPLSKEFYRLRKQLEDFLRG